MGCGSQSTSSPPRACSTSIAATSTATATVEIQVWTTSRRRWCRSFLLSSSFMGFTQKARAQPAGQARWLASFSVKKGGVVVAHISGPHVLEFTERKAGEPNCACEGTERNPDFLCEQTLNDS